MVRKLHLKADHALSNIQKQLPFSLLNPDNNDIKKKFLRKPFNPQFTYADKPDTVRIREELTSIKCGRTLIGKLLQQERDELIDKCALIEAIGTHEVTNACTKVYGKPNKKLVDKAQELLTLAGSPKDIKIRYDQTRNIMRETFKLLGFSYTIKKSDLVTSAALNPTKHLLEFKKKERFGKLYAYRLAVHEIATHALRAENGRQHELTIFSRGLPGYLATEEGLAAYNEERAGVMTTDILRNYAGRVYAIDVAKQEDFVGTYKALREFFDKEHAFKLALRVKRGLGNGEETGGCTKDHVYLSGYLGIKQYVANGGDLKPLYSGKIGLDDIKRYGKKLHEPAYIPEPVIEWVRHTLLTS